MPVNCHSAIRAYASLADRVTALTTADPDWFRRFRRLRLPFLARGQQRQPRFRQQQLGMLAHEQFLAICHAIVPALVAGAVSSPLIALGIQAAVTERDNVVDFRRERGVPRRVSGNRAIRGLTPRPELASPGRALENLAIGDAVPRLLLGKLTCTGRSFTGFSRINALRARFVKAFTRAELALPLLRLKQVPALSAGPVSHLTAARLTDRFGA